MVYINTLHCQERGGRTRCGCAGLPETRHWHVKQYMCVICGFIYDEEQGLPEQDIAPGTRWEDVPLNWQCPECGAGKDDFEMMEI